MISKSLSRKTPSFAQLASYIGSEKSDERLNIYQHVYARRENDIAREFFENSQNLKARKNGNYMYHEILSISLEDEVNRDQAKEALRELALQYIAERSPDALVFGSMHDDHQDHIHYHLMISANEKGSDKRMRLSRGRFDEIKRELESHCLQNYPELKQREVMTASREDKKLSRKAAELKRQGKKLDRRDKVKAMVFEAMINTSGLDEFTSKLEANAARYYQRGKNHGLEVTHDDGKVEKYRFSTLGVHEEFEHFLSVSQGFEKAKEDEFENAAKGAEKQKSEKQKAAKQKSAGEKEKTAQNGARRDTSRENDEERENPQYERDKYDGNARNSENESEKEHARAGTENPKNEANRDGSSEKEHEDMSNKPLRPDAPAYGTKENIDRRVEINKGEREPDPEMDIMSHEDWRKQDKFSHKWAQSWRRSIDDLRGKDRSTERDRSEKSGKDEPER